MTTGRPREYESRVSTTLRIDPDLLDAVQAEADRREIGRNKLLIVIIERGLPDYEAEEM